MRKTSVKTAATGSKNKNRPNSYKTRNGVYKTPSGTFCAQKQIDGVRYNANFKRKKDAIAYLNKLFSMTTSS